MSKRNHSKAVAVDGGGGRHRNVRGKNTEATRGAVQDVRFLYYTNLQAVLPLQ
jgi:hypothetical protein